MIFHILTILGIWFVVFVAITELVQRSIYGKLLSDKEIDAFLETRLGKYSINEFDEDGNLFFISGEPYLARSPFWGSTLSSSWHIRRIGRVPRWSRWHKTLETWRINMISLHSNT